LPSCGDGIPDVGEQCDDGNNSNNDACLNTCFAAGCGDGFTWIGMEECDDGNNSNNDGCVNSCDLAFCGDGFLWVGTEECDDGNNVNGDGCSATCTLPVCGDGIPETPEQCDLGLANADRPALEIEQGTLKTGVTPFDNPEDVAVFYDYFSASSHTGFEQVSASKIYFYRDIATEILSLIMHHGIDQFPAQPQAFVGFSLVGLPAVTSVAIADDVPSEFQKTSATVVAGNWSFAVNTDGGAITNFPFPGSWVVTLTSQFSGGINQWHFIDGGTSQATLQLNTLLILRAFATPSACRTDCTVPLCGDGILDGGEVCDDGNNVGGDGCAANCSSLSG
jgi:cysteine-rich repeat protein